MSDSLWLHGLLPSRLLVHGILQARVLEWVAISFSRVSSQPRDQTQVSRISGRRFNLWATSLDIWTRTTSQITKFSHRLSWSLETSLQVASVKPTILQGMIRGDVSGSPVRIHYAATISQVLCKSLGEGNGIPLQYSCLENPMDRGPWWAAVHGVSKSRTWLSDFTFTFHFHALEKEMATHSSILAWRIPGTGEPGGLPSIGSHRVGHDWSDLAAAAAACSSTIQSTVLRYCEFLIYPNDNLPSSGS